ncbi:DUF1028 domain-containing protein [Amnibacterium flavum]|uniref:DUF1028 domain-containing protein n=1 Tax=Amnibacterium flavum TaxID=2173173 RepID=A0A2V1HSZ1_9MICO|nr:DUF1028 domain-containing protein [Amnibacterium flavum]PVZ94782.1 DUF1028 domain-containing protein [Amnibacterium flavum]
MTFSIIARDPETGAFGIACETHFFGVGRLVGWLEPGVGVIATQAFVNVGFGPRGLDLLREGIAPQDALSSLIDGDDAPDVRQLAIIGPDGTVANFTGAKCVQSAGALSGDQVSVQGNMLASHDVYRSMLEAYESSAGEPFAKRLLLALRAGEDAGGDARGSQSAVLKIVSGNRGGNAWEETLLDLRVDDHPDPVTEITRLAEVSGAFDALGDVMFAPRLMLGEYEDVSDEELGGALDALDSARAILGDNLEASFWKAVLLGRADRDAESAALFAEVFERGPHWRPYLDSVAAAGFIAPEKVAALVSK